MTTDYSAMTNAELLTYWRNNGLSAELRDEIYNRTHGSNVSPILVIRLLADLEAARAEAQRLREQRDALAKLANYVQGNAVFIPDLDFYDLDEIARTIIEEIRTLLASIDAEDASAQGGEDDET